jgi:hypothetical protein
MIYTILSIYLLADHKKKWDMNSFIFFCCSYSKMTIFKLTIILVAILSVLEGALILVKSTKVYFLTLNGHRAILVLTSVIRAHGRLV